MRTIHGVLGGCMIVLLPEMVCAAAATMPVEKMSIPYVATRNDAVRDMLLMANVGKDDVVYDLGSGDGRIVIAAVRDFGARKAVGIENDPNRITESRANAAKAGVADRVEFIQGDLFKTDFSEATVVTLFLGHYPNIKLRPKLLTMLKPWARIVSHQFCMGEWQFDKQLTARTEYFGMWGEHASTFRDNPSVPDYTGNESHFGSSDKITLWVVPAPVAGVWRGKIETGNGFQDCKLLLHQRLSDVRGTLELAGHAEPLGAEVDMWGDHVRFVAGLLAKLEIRFDGRADADTMKGTLAVRENGKLTECAWETRRDKADLAGTWKLPSDSQWHSAQLRIERHAGKLQAMCYDWQADKEVLLTDFYNFGGGIYFTYFVGRDESGSYVISEDTGWLIAEGVLDGGQMTGKAEFYPCEGQTRRYPSSFAPPSSMPGEMTAAGI